MQPALPQVPENQRQVLLGSSLWDQAASGEPFMFCRWQPTLIAGMALDLDCPNGSI